MLVFNNLTAFFEEALTDLNCRYDTRSYLIRLYSDFRSTQNDLSNHNLTLLFSQAKLTNDFHLHQQLGDYIFWTKTMLPRHFNNSNDYYENLARLSYYSCYKLINKSWPLYEQLADDFRTLEYQARTKLQSIQI